jgi:tyrosine-protein kinase Etk/Wzc
MSNLNTSKPNDDEIDLIELMQTLWDAKFLIVVVTVISTVFGLVYALVAAPSYKITSRVSVHVYPAVTQQVCGASIDGFSIDCVKKETADAAITLLGSDWELGNAGSSEAQVTPESSATS